MLNATIARLRERHLTLLRAIPHRLSGQGGFTLVELLIVLVIIGILVLLAAPSYLSFKDRASKAAAQANVRSAVSAIEVYYGDTGAYTSMGLTSGAAPVTGGLRAINSSIQITVVSAGASTYCVKATQGNFSYYKNGPFGSITTTPCT